MKKIFFLLTVWAILFTGCDKLFVASDIREAKADYLESLVNLKNAEAERIKAEADYKQAVQNWEQNPTEGNKKAIEDILIKLQEYLSNILFESKKLTKEEHNAINKYVEAYRLLLMAEQNLRDVKEMYYLPAEIVSDSLSKMKVIEAVQVGKWKEIVEAFDIYAFPRDLDEFISDQMELYDNNPSQIHMDVIDKFKDICNKYKDDSRSIYEECRAIYQKSVKHYDMVIAVLACIESGKSPTDTIAEFIEEMKADVEVADKSVEAALKSYNQVMKNHE